MCHKLFFDGARKDRYITYGCVVFDHDNKITHQIQGKVKHPGLNSHMAEFVALIMGLLLCIFNNILEIEVYGDAKNVIEQMNDNKYKTKKTFYPFIIITKFLCHHFNKISFHWISREQNKEADKLTKN